MGFGILPTTRPVPRLFLRKLARDGSATEGRSSAILDRSCDRRARVRPSRRRCTIDLTIGINVRGRPGLQVRRPHGSGDYVFVHFLGPARLGHDGSLRVGRGDCVVWRPDSPSYVRSDTTIYNHFAHLSTDLAGPAFRQFPVVFDQVFTPRSTAFVRPLLLRLQREWVRRDAYWERAVQMSVHELALQLCRAGGAAVRRSASPHTDRLRTIRLRVHQIPAEPWTLSKLAQLAHLGESQFSALYRALFGRSPIDDLLRARLELARYYLAQTDLPVAAVGDLVGFAEPSHFSRTFRRHVGCSPRTFRASGGTAPSRG
jgi:AraC family transcriptional regulator, arabinose operon regulatory protein